MDSGDKLSVKDVFKEAAQQASHLLCSDSYGLTVGNNLPNFDLTTPGALSQRPDNTTSIATSVTRPLETSTGSTPATPVEGGAASVFTRSSEASAALGQRVVEASAQVAPNSTEATVEKSALSVVRPVTELSATLAAPLVRCSDTVLSMQSALPREIKEQSILQAAQQATLAEQLANPFQARVGSALTRAALFTGTDSNLAPVEGKRETERTVAKANEGPVERRNLPDGTALESRDGNITQIKKGANSVSLEYDENNRVIRISETINGRTSVSEAGKDFKLGNVSVNEHGDVKVVSADNKYSYTLTHEFTRYDRAIGPKGDGSDDRLMQMRLASGVTREFVYNEDNTKVVTIRDHLPTNNGKPLIEETTRIGNSNIWEFKTNYGKSGQRTNVDVGADGSFKFAEVKKPSVPSDLVDLDNSDAMHQDLVAARQHLKRVAASKGVFGGSAEMVGAWAYKFEQRCRDLAHTGRKAPSDQQIIKCYRELEKILDGSGQGVNSAERRALVEAALRSYANPRKYINQGSHPSCGFNMVERHVVQTYPDQHARILQEAVNRGKVTSADGKWSMRLHPHQIEPDREAVSVAKGGGWSSAWSYSNKIFQIAAIKLGHPGYRGNGHGFPGATEDQCRTANKFLTGENKLPILNRWWGGKPSFNSLQDALKRGTIGYMVPGHMMTIDEAKVVNGVAYVHVDNSWGGSGDGWRRWSNV